MYPLWTVQVSILDRFNNQPGATRTMKDFIFGCVVMTIFATLFAYTVLGGF